MDGPPVQFKSYVEIQKQTFLTGDCKEMSRFSVLIYSDVLTKWNRLKLVGSYSQILMDQEP